jgi:Fe2+ transport system protein FeoA
MSSTILAFTSDRKAGSKRTRPDDHAGAPVGGADVEPVVSDPPVQPLSTLAQGVRGVVIEVRSSDDGRVDRLLGLGVTPGARVTVLQTLPGIVFLCDQTELAVERRVAESILVATDDRSL